VVKTRDKPDRQRAGKYDKTKEHNARFNQDSDKREAGKKGEGLVLWRRLIPAFLPVMEQT
jgi:hypothetical protein